MQVLAQHELDLVTGAATFTFPYPVIDWKSVTFNTAPITTAINGSINSAVKCVNTTVSKVACGVNGTVNGTVKTVSDLYNAVRHGEITIKLVW